METQERLLNEVIMSQMNALCVRLDMSYRVTEAIGDNITLSFHNVYENVKILEALPELVSDILLENLQKNLRSNGTEKRDVIYFNCQNQQKKVKIISNLITSLNQSYFIVTFIPQEVLCEETHKVNNGYESFEEAKRQLEFSESRYNSFFENDPVMHLSVNPETSLIADCNLYTINKMGYQSKTEIIGRPVHTIFTKERKEKCLTLIEKFKSIGYLDSEEMELKTKSGGSIPVILYTTAQRDEKGKVLLSRSTLVDISELKNTQKKLNKKSKRLENLNAELEQLVSTCSHDLQEPLATIKFANDLLDKLYREKLDEKGRDYISYIDQAVDRLSSQIRSLLSHIQIGQNSKRVSVNTNELVNTVLQDLGNSIVSSKAKVSIQNKLPTIKAFPVELRLLFQNLISNAIKYSKKGITPKIEISSLSDDKYSSFSVKDNGIGISELDQEEIFKIFSRVQSKDDSQSGDGVGLAHCEKIIRMHEGEISVKSKLGKGSIFNFRLMKNYIL